MRYINGISSDTLLVIQGTPEGSIMAHALFLIYINDLQTSLPEPDTTACTDDLALIASNGNADMVALKLQFL